MYAYIVRLENFDVKSPKQLDRAWNIATCTKDYDNSRDTCKYFSSHAHISLLALHKD